MKVCGWNGGTARAVRTGAGAMALGVALMFGGASATATEPAHLAPAPTAGHGTAAAKMAPAPKAEATHPIPATAAHPPPAVGHGDHGTSAATVPHGESGTHAAAGAATHGGGHGKEHGAVTPELPNLVSIVLAMDLGDGLKVADTKFGHFLHTWEKTIFMFLIIGLAVMGMKAIGKMRAGMPGRTQAAAETAFEGMSGFLMGILGEEKNRRFVPFLMTLFFFIYLQNIAGIMPLMTGATSAFTTTLALALMVFFYVHFNAIDEGGFKHYMLHFVGNPTDAITWVIGILMIPLEIVATLAKPLSLSLRLFGNMMGEHILVGVFLMMGIGMAKAIIPFTPVGIPLHLPFMFLALLTTLIQALVFTLLSTIYILLLLPHGHHDEDHGHGPIHADDGQEDGHGIPAPLAV